MPQLVVDPESINLGCLEPGEGATSSIKITGGPVIAIVGNDRIKVDPVKIEQEQGIMRIEVQAGVEGDLLWDEIILQRGSEEKRVVVTAWWEYATSEIVVESDQPPVPQGIYTSRESDTKRLYEGRVCLFCGRNRRYDSESRTWLKCEYCKSYNNILHLWIRLVRSWG